MRMVTAEQFKARTGRDPVEDDLERANCKKAGEIGHMACGWCAVHDGPQAECGCTIKASNLLAKHSWTRFRGSQKYVLCQVCHEPTTALATEHCARCWALKISIENDPAIAAKIFSDYKIRFRDVPSTEFIWFVAGAVFAAIMIALPDIAAYINRITL